MAGSLDPSLSPDEHRVAFYRTVNAQPDVWLLDTRRSVLTRFTSEGRALRPIWSPDGSEMVYAAGMPTNLFRRPVAGHGVEHAILETSQPKAATDWSRDGRFILYRSNDPQSGWDLWALPLEGAGIRSRLRERASMNVTANSLPDGNGSLVSRMSPDALSPFSPSLDLAPS